MLCILMYVHLFVALLSIHILYHVDSFIIIILDFSEKVLLSVSYCTTNSYPQTNVIISVFPFRETRSYIIFFNKYSIKNKKCVGLASLSYIIILRCLKKVFKKKRKKFGDVCLSHHM